MALLSQLHKGYISKSILNFCLISKSPFNHLTVKIKGKTLLQGFLKTNIKDMSHVPCPMLIQKSVFISVFIEKKNYLMKNDSYRGYIKKKNKKSTLYFIQFNFFHKPEIANFGYDFKTFLLSVEEIF
jgi:hypothetical protein